MKKESPSKDLCVSAGETKIEEARPALVPKLRFPEFREMDGWEEKSIGQACKSFSGGTPNTAQKEFYGGSIPFIRSAEIDRAETELFLTEEGLNNSAAKLVTKGDVLLALYGANSGDVALARIDGAINQAILCLKSDSSNTFVYQFLSLRKNWIINTYLQGGQGNLSGEIVKSILLGLPSPAEQQKIAECLSSLDELMAAQARKVDALKTHKKGLMQQLFPREGETQPRLRFPEFRDAGVWESAILGDLSLVVRGGSPRPIDGFLTTASDGLNWLKIGDVDKEAKYVTSTLEKVRPEALSKTRVVNPGDLILSNSMSFGRPYILQIKTCIHDGWIAITDIAKKADRDFLYYLISAPSSQNYFADNAAGTGVQNLNADIIKALPVNFPTPAEQQKIAECLSSLDALITAEANKLEALKTHKKGLMQQLFPSPEEV